MRERANKKAPPERMLLRGEDRAGAERTLHAQHSRTASPPHQLSFGTMRRRDHRSDLSRFGQRLNPAMPVLTVGVSRRCWSAAYCHMDASP